LYFVPSRSPASAAASVPITEVEKHAAEPQKLRVRGPRREPPSLARVALVRSVRISPAQHQVHHSVDAKHHHRNFGSALAIWDWMFGTRRGIEILVGARRQREGHRPGPDATPTAARGRSLLPH